MTSPDNPHAPYWKISIDQQIGSLLERWATRDTEEYCRFCAVEHVGDVEPDAKYCSEQCERRFQRIMEARIALGKRDLSLRGYD